MGKLKRIFTMDRFSELLGTRVFLDDASKTMILFMTVKGLMELKSDLRNQVRVEKEI